MRVSVMRIRFNPRQYVGCDQMRMAISFMQMRFNSRTNMWYDMLRT